MDAPIWPFLGVLLEERPAVKGDDGSSGPRVRGLGFTVSDGVLATLEHVAERATLFGDAPVRLIGAREGVATMALDSTAYPPARLGAAEPGQACAVATVSDDSPFDVQTVPGSIGELSEDGHFTVALDGFLSEYRTASGSPVVVDGEVVGIVGPTATNRSVDAFGLSALLERVVPRLSAAAGLTVEHAAGIDAVWPVPERAPAMVLLGALRAALDYEPRTVADALLGRLPGDSLALVRAAHTALDIEWGPPIDGPGPPALEPVVRRADEIRARVGGPAEIHLRHLLAAALTAPPDAFPDPLLATLGASLSELRDVLRGAIGRFVPDEPPEVWDAILARFELAGGVSADLVDPTRGIAMEDDHLGVGDYVRMLATVIADSRTPMPLSIGLFGEWGSGKSYFMGLLRDCIQGLSDSGEQRYHRNIRQIGFNAWHYADSNLWASLGDEIFEQLAGPDETNAERRQRLRSDLSDRLQRRKELEAARARARDETARLTTELDTAAVERQQSATALVRAVGDQLGKAWDKLGVDDEVEQGRLLADELRRTPQDVAVVRRSLSGRAGWIVTVVFAAAVAAVALGVAGSLEWVTGTGLAALTAALTAAGALAARVRSGVRLLHEVAEGVREDSRKAVADRLKALRRAEAEERVLQAQLDEVIGQVGELGRELAELGPGQRLYRFVAERAASDEYRRQLGLISTIRKDFEQLIELMDDWKKRTGEGEENVPDPIDRIVLYIDDLDRCSSEQVVEVLQAVHLLLALDLFVVVVGVDPRWLLRSLRRQYRTMLTSGGQAAPPDAWWETTPQDYLEKIFNIPFALPRMSPGSFNLLIQSLARPAETEGAATGDGATAARAPELAPAEGAAATQEPRPEGARLEAAEITVEERSEVAALRAGEVQPESRPLTDPELELLAALAPLVETPREAKRLMNLYRMIRSTRDLAPAARFLGDDTQPGEYQAVVILLGLLSGHARLLENVLVARPREGVLGGLRYRRADGTWAAFVSDMEPKETGDGWQNQIVGPIAEADLANWRHLAGGLAGATALVKIPDLRPFQLWAPRIARFSFLLSPYAGEGEEEAAAAAAATRGGPSVTVRT